MVRLKTTKLALLLECVTNIVSSHRCRKEYLKDQSENIGNRHFHRRLFCGLVNR